MDMHDQNPTLRDELLRDVASSGFRRGGCAVVTVMLLVTGAVWVMLADSVLHLGFRRHLDSTNLAIFTVFSWQPKSLFSAQQPARLQRWRPEDSSLTALGGRGQSGTLSDSLSTIVPRDKDQLEFGRRSMLAAVLSVLGTLPQPSAAIQEDGGKLKEQGIEKLIVDLERQTGVKLRIFTKVVEIPGPSIPDHWISDADTVVLEANFNFLYLLTGQFLKFRVGRGLDKVVPPAFWPQLEQRFGTKFWLQNGVPAVLDSTIAAINACIRDPANAAGTCEIVNEIKR
eukprot:gnl/TRDRNA2_/TRDRNA2_171501_c0_seq3.p1 gnl/TRDRNA2_/TRDRNA2_171501_c0~~gnl/TRDRNA2_/TRDRNA2_171501_c0_seq3.p1  ORF type:complete len:284 (+),score=29.73 gnl/TRDRNA2_/TRDRNA2_171501_c0_seq3:77-928(+)